MKTNTVTVMFDTPGVIAIGPYEHGKHYQVTREEAQRLCQAKQFKRVDDPAPITIDREE